MSRLFVAIDLPEDVKRGVADIGGKLPGARWVPMSQLHLTLRFIGEVDDVQFQAIKAELSGVTVPTFHLALKGVGHFPPGKHPRVLWVGVEGAGPLLELQQKVELALIGAGVAPEERHFSPHITLARLKETPATAVVALEEQHASFRTSSFPVEEFYLYSSTLTRDGAIHTREATYPLLGEG
jgi:RNA 2',3'-cyclic 3'-phosphodiesterase